MLIRGRSCIAAFMACVVLLFVSTAAHPSYDTEGGRKYAVASQRLADLRKSSKQKKYRSYWIDCIRTFELVEKKYPRSPSAADASFDRATVYEELSQYNKASKDIEEALRSYGKFPSSYPKHPRAPEALYRVVEISLTVKKDTAAANEAYTRLAATFPDSAWTGKAKALVSPPLRGKRRQEPELRKVPAPVISAAGKPKSRGVVQKIRYWSGGAHTRIVIEQSNEVRFQAQEIKNPDRLVFDIFNSRLGRAVDKDPFSVNDGILKQVRASQYAPDIVRVVLDLASIKSYVAFPLHEPERLVIDVTGEGGKAAESPVASGNTDTQQEPGGEKLKSAATVEAPPVAPPLFAVPEEKNNDGGKLSLSRQLGLKIKTIAIDAGHGGHDPGAIGKTGLKEKNVTLDIAKRLAVLVRDRLGCNVVMTRDRDVFVQLEDRPAIALTKGADLFVSIHVNANRKRNARGIETYVQGLRASDREAMATAARENAMSTKKLSELKSELDRIFADFAQDDKIEESLYLADSVQGSLVDNMKTLNRHAADIKARFKRAFFYVLINTKMPSILAEVGFISNLEEEKLLKKDSYRQAIAEALFQGVKKYVEARGQQVAGR